MRWFWGALTMTALAACALGADLDGFTSGGLPAEDAGSNGPSDASTTGDAGARVVGEDSGMDAGPECKGTKGPRPVRVGSYCIDSTEVTVADYQAFLADKGDDTSGQPPECSWNTSYAPFALGDPKLPVHGPDWCDAFMYCAWAGKRLCGRIGGGPTPESGLANPLSDEWYRACSNEGTRRRPYGDDFEQGACVTQRPEGPIQVATHPRCEGGFPGLFDMGGNLWEWEDSCGAGDGEADCVIRGGSFAPNNTDTCAQVGWRSRNRGQDSFDVTIRCCSDLL